VVQSKGWMRLFKDGCDLLKTIYTFMVDVGMIE